MSIERPIIGRILKELEYKECHSKGSTDLTIKEFKDLQKREQLGEFKEIDAELEKLRKVLQENRVGHEMGLYSIHISPESPVRDVLKIFNLEDEWSYLAFKFTSNQAHYTVYLTDISILPSQKTIDSLGVVLDLTVQRHGSIFPFDSTGELEAELKNVPENNFGVLRNKRKLFEDDDKYFEEQEKDRKREMVMRLRLLASRATEFANMIDEQK